MPDIQSELSKVLNEWDKPIEETNQPEKQMQTLRTHLFKTTNNVTRNTFNVVRDNPGITKKEAMAKLTAQGFNPASTTSILAQMVRQRLMREEGGGLHVNFSEYIPLKSGAARAALQGKAVKKPKKDKAIKVIKEASGIAALQPQATPAPRSAIITTNFSVDALIKNLTIMQAKELRDTLNNLFK
jgi:hypothetical protein